MATISRIRLTNVIYENGSKRYNDQIFNFNGQNSAILLENGGGKTVLIQTILQAILPAQSLAGRKLRQTLVLDHRPAHIAIEWLLAEKPRKYALTAVSLYIQNQELCHHKYVYIYSEENKNEIEEIPFSLGDDKQRRAASADEIGEYYREKTKEEINAHYFRYKQDYHKFLQEELDINTEEFLSLAQINNEEGGVASFFDNCKTTSDLVYRLLIPKVNLFLLRQEKESFSELYKKKRANLQEYKKCKNILKQNEKIISDLKKLVEVYYKLQINLDEFNGDKRKLRAYEDKAIVEQEKIHQKCEEDKKKADYIKEQREIIEKTIKEAEYSIELVEYREKEKEKKLLHNRILDKEAIYKETVQNYRQLEYLLKRDEKNEASAKLKLARKNLENYHAKYSDDDLRNQLKIIMEELHWYYQLDETQLSDKINHLNARSKEVQDEIDKNLQKESEIQNELLLLKERMGTLIGEIKADKKQKEQIEKEILLNLERESILEEKSKWEIDSRLCMQKISQMMQIKEKSAIDIVKINEEILKIEEERQKLELILQRIDDYLAKKKKDDIEISSLLSSIASGRVIRDLYEDKAKIDGLLEIRLDRNEKEKEEAIILERKKTRLADDYSEMDFFILNPELKDIFNRQDFIVESGSIYLNRLVAEGYGRREELLQVTPFWPSILVVSFGREKLLEWLENNKARLSMPVLVMTPKEIDDLWHGGSVKYDCIQPDFWQQALFTESFSKWQDELRNLSTEAHQLRLEKEFEYENIRDINKAWLKWQNDHPENKYRSKIEKKQEIENRYHFLLDMKRKQENDLLEAKAKEKEAIEKIQDLEGQNKYLSEKIMKAQRWQRIDVLCQEKKVELDIIKKEEKRKYEQKEEYLSINRELLKVYKKIQEEYTKTEITLKTLRNESLWQELQNYDVKQNIKGREVLKEEKRVLEENLQKVYYEEKSLKDRINECEKSYQKSCDMLEEYDFTLPEDRVFPLDGMNIIKRLKYDAAEQAKEKAVLTDSLHSLEHVLWMKEGQMNEKKKEFQKNYDTEPSIISDEPQNILAIEKEKLSEIIKSYHYNEIEIIKDEEKRLYWDKICERLTNAVHQYMCLELSPISLEEGEINDFLYSSSKKIRELEKVLEEKEYIVKKSQRNAEKLKNECLSDYKYNEKIDEKMKRNCILGLENKNSYRDMREWYENVNEKIVKVNGILEETIRTQDEDLQQLLNRINQYLVSICDEIKLIEKMTTIKLENGLRSIYEIKVPEWEEATAKENLIYFFSKLEDDLISDKYRDEENGKEKIEARIESAFTPQSLFNIVCREKKFSVNVRKVVNREAVLDMPISWEQSNKWSGGERWSKNMALFLGIQKYLAQKNSSSNQDDTRMVILDNPFGQASSDYLLEPVFYIASKLRFQIIALTALSGETFIRNYFPVVYSCRLRKSGDSSIMQASLNIKEAYFEDKKLPTTTKLRQERSIDIYTNPEVS